jgi:hypothetical protein
MKNMKSKFDLNTIDSLQKTKFLKGMEFVFDKVRYL